jgi:hypothetical protein
MRSGFRSQVIQSFEASRHAVMSEIRRLLQIDPYARRGRHTLADDTMACAGI